MDFRKVMNEERFHIWWAYTQSILQPVLPSSSFRIWKTYTTIKIRYRVPTPSSSKALRWSAPIKVQYEDLLEVKRFCTVVLRESSQ